MLRRSLAPLLALAVVTGCLAPGPTALAPVPSNIPEDISLAEYLAVRRTSNELGGTILGTLVGGVLGALIGGKVGYEIGRPIDLARGCEDCGLDGLLIGGGIGGVGGLMVGAAIGADAGRKADHRAAIEKARRKKRGPRSEPGASARDPLQPDHQA